MHTHNATRGTETEAMRRNGTGILATGAILGGAAIGVGATLALFGNPFDRAVSAEAECGSLQEVAARWNGWWNAATGEHGYRYVTACPRGGFRYGFSYVPSSKPDGLTVKQTFMLPIRVRRVEMGGDEAGKRGRREVRAGIERVGRNRWKVPLTFERDGGMN